MATDLRLSPVNLPLGTAKVQSLLEDPKPCLVDRTWLGEIRAGRRSVEGRWVRSTSFRKSGDALKFDMLRGELSRTSNDQNRIHKEMIRTPWRL